MTGLLGPIPGPKTCRNGHGELVREPGLFGLVGVQELRPRTAAETLVGKQLPKDSRQYGRDDRVLVVIAWRCQTCGYIELCDEDYG